jgi:REP element-mobilizing transposase RayT
MPRRLRLEYPLAIHHVMARGNARQDIVHDDDDRRKWIELLERTVALHGWELFAFVLLTNHFHLLLRTPRPNLSRGMQRLLSGHATGWARRHRRGGHVFQGRFRAQLVEDETYYWTVSRYLHLNPVRAGLVAHPRDWPWSSYPGYDHRRRRVGWVAYETLLGALQAGYGAADPAASYRRYVTAGLGETETVASPLDSAWRGLVLGSPEFVGRVKARLSESSRQAGEVSSRQLAGPDRTVVYEAVLAHHGRSAEALTRRGARDHCRGLAAYLARRHTDATLAQVAMDLGLSRADSVPNLTRRIEKCLTSSPALRDDLRAIEEALRGAQETKNNV